MTAAALKRVQDFKCTQYLFVQTEQVMMSCNFNKWQNLIQIEQDGGTKMGNLLMYLQLLLWR